MSNALEGSVLYNPAWSKEERETLDRYAQNQSRLYLIGDMTRVGVSLFNVKMEYTHFAPRSGKNFLFEMTLLKWPENNMIWAITSFPIEYEAKAKSIGNECGIRIADGVPTIIDSTGMHYFPINGPTVFTLENSHGHPVYNNDQKAINELKQQHKVMIDSIIEADRKLMVEEMLRSGYSQQQIRRIVSKWDAGDESYDETPELAKDGQHRHSSHKS